MKFRPLYDRVLIERVEEKTNSGIVIPDSAKEKPCNGVVLEVGMGKRGDDGKCLTMEVKKGDKVLFGKYSGTEVKIDGKECTVLEEKDILGIFA